MGRIVGLDGQPLQRDPAPAANAAPDPNGPEKIAPTADEQKVLDEFNAHMSLTEGRRYIQLNIFLNNYMKLLPGTPTMEQTLQVFGMDLHEVLHTHGGSFRSAIYGKTGRNDVCPCGSGDKYKKCCLERDDTVVQVKTSAPNPDYDDGVQMDTPDLDETMDLGMGSGMGEQIDLEDAIADAESPHVVASTPTTKSTHGAAVTPDG